MFKNNVLFTVLARATSMTTGGLPRLVRRLDKKKSIGKSRRIRKTDNRNTHNKIASSASRKIGP